MLRINISIPSDLYEECQKKCEKQRISFSQLVRNALMNHLKNDNNTKKSQNEADIKKIVDVALTSHLADLQQRMTDLENYYYVLQKIPIKSEDSNPTNKKNWGNNITKK